MVGAAARAHRRSRAIGPGLARSPSIGSSAPDPPAPEGAVVGWRPEPIGDARGHPAPTPLPGPQPFRQQGAFGTVRRVEEIIVIRLEGQGTFALPVDVLRPYEVPEADQAIAAPRSDDELGAVPVILREDFLLGATPRRDDLVVDAFGCVRHRGGHPLFGRPG